jgi:predicted membrane channel-forming protein YqfA (hemolysin III family)
MNTLIIKKSNERGKKKMKKSTTTEIMKKETEMNKIQKIGSFLNRYSYVIAFAFVLLISASNVAFASSNADTLWTTISDLMKTWVTRLGGVVMFVGGVMFGLGWKNNDAEQKSQGISTIVAGAIVVAVAALTGTFFA